MKIYLKVKAITGKILQIYSDANSCYDLAFKRMGIEEQHFMTIRDNLARFNRKTKRYSKFLEMLKISLDLFFHKDFILSAMKC